MKAALFSILLFTIFPITIYSQNLLPHTDIRFNGPVKRIAQYTLLSDAILNDSIHPFLQNYSNHFENFYDKKGRLVEQLTCASQTGSVNSRVVNSYHKKGYLLTTSVYDIHNEKIFDWVFEYEKKKLIKAVQTDVYGIVKEYILFEKEESTGADVQKMLNADNEVMFTVKQQFDDGIMIYKQTFDQKDQLLFLVNQEVDEKSKITLHKTVNKSSGMESTEVYNYLQYDQHNNWILREERDNVGNLIHYSFRIIEYYEESNAEDISLQEAIKGHWVTKDLHGSIELNFNEDRFTLKSEELDWEGKWYEDKSSEFLVLRNSENGKIQKISVNPKTPTVITVCFDVEQQDSKIYQIFIKE